MAPWDSGDGDWPEGSAAAHSAARPGVDEPFEGGDQDRYELGPELGRGGMGRVCTAVDKRLGREVAIKELREGRDPRRMAREARITALLEHPGIVPVYDAGVTPDGRPFYAMRLVRGRPLSDVLRDTPTRDERLKLLRRVLDAAEAVAFAHSLGVVHRDIKPANIVLGEYGETQVVDWGLARAQGEPELEREMHGESGTLTQAGAVLGTPAYMSPEQAAGEAGDKRSDVWSLGVLLFELVEGRTPYAGPSSDEVLRQVRSKDPPRLTEPAELAAIVARALNRDPDRRYGDAGALAADLSSFIDGRRVQAYAYSTWELAQRIAKAWRIPLLILAAATVGIGVVGWVGLSNTTAERDRALTAEADLTEALATADQQLQRALIAQAEVRLEQGRHAAAEVLAANALALGESPEARGVLAAFGLRERPMRVSVEDLPECRGSRVSADGSIRLCIHDGVLSLWDSGAERWSVGLAAEALALSPSGERVLVGLGDRVLELDSADGSVLRTVLGYRGMWPIETGEHGEPAVVWAQTTAVRPLTDEGLQVGGRCAGHVGATFPTPDGVVRLCRDGRVLLGDEVLVEQRAIGDMSVGTRADQVLWLGTNQGEIVRADLTTGQVAVWSTDAGLITAIAATDQLVAAAVEDGDVLIVQADTGVELSRVPVQHASWLRFGGPRELLVFGRHLERWRLPTDLSPLRLDSGSGLAQVQVSPSGEQLLTAHGGSFARLWDLSTGEVLREERFEGGVVKSAVFSGDGRAIAMGAVGSHIRRVDLASGAVTESELAGRRMAWMADDALLVLSFGPSGWIYEVGRERRQVVLGASWDLGVSADRSQVAIAGEQGVQLVEPGRQRVITEDEAVAVDVEGDRIALADRRRIWLVDHDGESQLDFQVDGQIWDIAFSPDATLIAAGTSEGRTHLHRTDTGELVAVLPGHLVRVATVDFAPDGSFLVSGSWDGSARLYSLAALDAPADELVDRVERAWGLTLEDVLPGVGSGKDGQEEPAL